MHALALTLLQVTPRQRVHAPIADEVFVAFVDLPVIFERTIKEFAALFNVQHQGARGIPRVHQDRAKRHLLMLNGVVEHLAHVIEF